VLTGGFAQSQKICPHILADLKDGASEVFKEHSVMNRIEPRRGLSLIALLVAICACLALGSVCAWLLLKGSVFIVPIFEPRRVGRLRSRPRKLMLTIGRLFRFERNEF
jgi:hypothetical protein